MTAWWHTLRACCHSWTVYVWKINYRVNIMGDRPGNTYVPFHQEESTRTVKMSTFALTLVHEISIHKMLQHVLHFEPSMLLIYCTELQYRSTERSRRHIYLFTSTFHFSFILTPVCKSLSILLWMDDWPIFALGWPWRFRSCRSFRSQRRRLSRPYGEELI